MISILIVNYNTRELLRNTLISIQKFVDIPYEVIVVDNASSDQSYELLSPIFPDFTFIKSEENLGFAKGNNLALSHAKGDFIFFLNPDTEIQDHSLEKLHQYLHQNPKVGIVAPKLVYGNGTIQRSKRPFYSFWGSLFDNRFMNPIIARYPFITKMMPFISNHSESGRADWIKGAAFLMRGDLARKLNGFDEQFWIYGEEMDLCKQVWNSGFEVHYLSEAVIVHFEGQSTRQSSQKMFIQNYKSLYLYLKKNHTYSELLWYHRRVQLFINLFLLQSSISKWSSKKNNENQLYTALKQWVKTEGNELVRNAA